MLLMVSVHPCTCIVIHYRSLPPMSFDQVENNFQKN